MSLVLKSEKELREFFERALKTLSPEDVVIFNDQRDTIRKILREESEKAGRELVEKDLLTLKENEIGAMNFDEKSPHWMKKLFEGKCEKGVTLFLREYYQCSEKVKDDILNLMVKREVQGEKFPCKTLIVLSIQGSDEIPRSISHLHSLHFYKKDMRNA